MTTLQMAMLEGPLPQYREMLASGKIESDPAQYLAIEKLQLLANRLSAYKSPKKTDLFSFFTRRSGEVPEGLYLFGGVGRGKTMLMDLFFNTIAFAPKRRLHFHEFMSEVHDLIGEARKKHEGDPIPHVADNIVKKSLLLCFDEFHVTDIADAMILWRLFSALFERHMIIVATSNVPPSGLYKDGLNRNAFLPFIDLLENHMEVMEMEAARDYRLAKMRGQQLYLTPLTEKTPSDMAEIFRTLTGRQEGGAAEISVKERRVDIPLAALGVAKFRFDQLCEMPLGALDYLAIARAYHTVMIENIPVLGPHKRNEARRFITLIDTLYDNGIILIVSAAAEPEKLYVSGDDVFLFQRTISRLNEMRSEAYISSVRKRETRQIDSEG